MTTQKPEALRLAANLEANMCHQAARELRRQHARIVELEGQLEAIGAGGVEPLRKQAAAPLPLLLRDIARDLGITVPQACIALKPLGNYSTNSAVTAEMARMLRDHFPATAHPAEGVPEQAAKLPPLPEPTAFLVCKGSEVTARAWNIDQMRAYAAAAIAATHPTQQGMDAQDAARWRMVALISRETMIHPDKRTATEAVAAYMHAVHSGLDIQGAVDAAIAAQAKQGGAA